MKLTDAPDARWKEGHPTQSDIADCAGFDIDRRLFIGIPLLADADIPQSKRVGNIPAGCFSAMILNYRIMLFYFADSEINMVPNCNNRNILPMLPGI